MLSEFFSRLFGYETQLIDHVLILEMVLPIQRNKLDQLDEFGKTNVDS